VKLEKEIRAILSGYPVLYLPGLPEAQPVPISGVDKGLVWWLQGDHSHAIPPDLVPTLAGGGIAFKRGDSIEYMLVTLDQADELDRADTMAAMNAQREYFKGEEQAAFLKMVVAALDPADAAPFPEGPARPPAA
jgi:hypothetical protein